MSYYQCNSQEILQRKDLLKKKQQSIMHKTKKHWKKSQKNWYKNLSQKEKDKIKEYQKKGCQQLVKYKKEVLQNK